jgi:serine protease Do
MKIIFILFYIFYSANATNYADIVEQIMPTVVSISSSGQKEIINVNNDKLFIFGNKNTINQQKINNIGSGFIISSDGYIVTNYHIIEDTQNCIITLFNKKEYKAKIIGFDKKTDLALLKIDSKDDFVFAEISQIDDYRVGDEVLAIGNPFGFGHTVTAGIISAKSRNINNNENDFIQTDASINQGNSGGPLFNIKGKVIGINNMIISQNDNSGNVGIGFAIPGHSAVKIIEKIKNNIKIIRPWIGISYYAVNEEIADAVQLKDITGVFVHNTEFQSPASKAGIKKGDVILTINNIIITKHSSISQIIYDIKIGTAIEVELWRFGKKIKTKIILEQQKDEIKIENILTNATKINSKIGITAKELNQNIKKQLKINDDINGVIITSIQNNIILENDILHKGDVVVQINEMTTNTIKSFNAAIQVIDKKQYKSVVFYIYKNGEIYPLPVKFK